MTAPTVDQASTRPLSPAIAGERLVRFTMHELNNLFGVTLGHADLIQDSPDDGDGTRRSIERIITATNRSEQVLAHFVSLAELGRAPATLGSLIDHLVPLLELAWSPMAIETACDRRAAGLVLTAAPVIDLLIDCATRLRSQARKNSRLIVAVDQGPDAILLSMKLHLDPAALQRAGSLPPEPDEAWNQILPEGLVLQVRYHPGRQECIISIA